MIMEYTRHKTTRCLKLCKCLRSESVRCCHVVVRDSYRDRLRSAQRMGWSTLGILLEPVFHRWDVFDYQISKMQLSEIHTSEGFWQIVRVDFRNVSDGCTDRQEIKETTKEASNKFNASGA